MNIKLKYFALDIDTIFIHIILWNPKCMINLFISQYLLEWLLTNGHHNLHQNIPRNHRSHMYTYRIRHAPGTRLPACIVVHCIDKLQKMI